VPDIEKDAAQDSAAGEQWPGIDSHFRLIAVAALRSKQLLRGARPRIDADPQRRRNTSIALEEVKRGLVPFTITVAQPDGKANDDSREGAISAD
jgi:DNA-directed RNA polymerase omega subunit